eukprot:g20060.t1
MPDGRIGMEHEGYSNFDAEAQLQVGAGRRASDWRNQRSFKSEGRGCGGSNLSGAAAHKAGGVARIVFRLG